MSRLPSKSLCVGVRLLGLEFARVRPLALGGGTWVDRVRWRGLRVVERSKLCVLVFGVNSLDQEFSCGS